MPENLDSIVASYRREKEQDTKDRENIQQIALELVQKRPNANWQFDSLINSIQEKVDKPDNMILGVLWQLIANDQLTLTHDWHLTE
jgi:hypothetical protein